MNVKDKLLYAAVVTAMGITMVPANVYALEQDQNAAVVEGQTADQVVDQDKQQGDKEAETVKISLNYDKIGGVINDRNGQPIEEDFTVKKGEEVELQFLPWEGYVISVIRLNDKKLDGAYHIEFKAEEDTVVSVIFEKATIAATLDKTSKDFGESTEGYKAVKAQQFILTNTGNDYMLVKKPTAKNYVVEHMGLVGVDIPEEQRDADVLSLHPGEAVAFEVRPKDGLKAGNYDEKVSVMIGFDNPDLELDEAIKTVGATLNLSFDVKAKAPAVKPQPAKPVKDDKIPQTGDPTQVGMLASMLAMSGLGMVGLKRKRGR